MEEEDSEDGEDEVNQEKQRGDIEKKRDRVDRHLDELLEPLETLDESEKSCDSEYPENSCDLRPNLEECDEALAERVHDEVEDTRGDHEEVKLVPAGVEVALQPVADQFHASLYDKDNRENEVYLGHQIVEALRRGFVGHSHRNFFFL